MPQGKGTYGSKKGRPPKRIMGPGTKPKRPRLTKEEFDKSVEQFKDVKDAVSKKNVHQDSRSKRASTYRRMFDNPQLGLKPKTKSHTIHKSTGGRVKLMHGGSPSARTRHIENEKEEIRRVDRNIRRNEGYKTGGRVKKAKGGMMTSGMKKAVRTMMADWDDSGKRLSPHQNPRSKMSSALRHMRDNPPKKKPRNIHTDPKKRTMKDMYLKHLKNMPKKPKAKGVPKPMTKKSARRKK